MTKTALITGITGQDGAYLAKFLVDKGYKVFGTYRRSSTPNFWRLQYIGVFDKITLIPADMADMASLMEAITVSQCDELYNLAAQSYVGASFDQPLHTADIDGVGATKILEIIRHLRKDIKFYQASTSELYGANSNTPQSEKTEFIPNSPYAAAKLYSFHITRIYREAYNIFASNGILFNHECVSENIPVIVRNKKTNVISIQRIKDIRKAREKSTNVQQWLITDLEIWDGEQFVELKVLTATRRKKEEDDFHCKTINTRHGIVETTNHHTLLLEDNTKVKTKTIQNGSKLLHKEFPVSNTFATLTQEEALFLGMMVGDGYISEDKKGQFSNNNEEIMAEFEQLWKKVALGTITVRDFKTEFGHTTQAKLNGNTNYLKTIREEIYTNDGFKKVPDKILNASYEGKIAFLVGYNITDGLKAAPTAYYFKNFKTNSIVLAQGLLFLISQTTEQEYNITFEEDEKYYGYYSINFLSPVKNQEKQELVEILLEDGYSQRGIQRDTSISRTFIRKIQNGGQAQLVHHLAKQKEEVKKILYHKQQPEWVYDIATTSGRFMAGVGTMVIANSPLRGLEFVTRKITNSVARIKLDLQKEIKLGNLDAKRDWGFAPEYVEAMWMMTQHKKPDDFVVATGETHTVREFCQLAFEAAGLNHEDFVKVDKMLIRPLDVPVLCGDHSKITQELGWKPKTKFKELVSIMVKEDLKRWERYHSGEMFPWDSPNYPTNMSVIKRSIIEGPRY